MGEFNLRSTCGDPIRVFCGDRLRGVAAGEHIGVLKGVCLGVALKFLFFEPKKDYKYIQLFLIQIWYDTRPFIVKRSRAILREEGKVLMSWTATKFEKGVKHTKNQN